LSLGTEPGSNPSQDAIAEARIQPVSDAYTGDEATQAIAAVETAVVEEEIAAAFDGSLDAEMLYTNVCAACHETGLAGAPQPGTDAMAERTAKGMDALMETAIGGLNAMPARGGRADLSDEQMKVIIEFMTE